MAWKEVYTCSWKTISNSVDPDETAHMSRLIWSYAVCKSLLWSLVAVEELMMSRSPINLEKKKSDERVTPLSSFDTIFGSIVFYKHISSFDNRCAICFIWAVSSKTLLANVHRMCRCISSCTCTKCHLDLCSPFIHSVVSKDSVSG